MTVSGENKLAEALSECFDDPLRYVMMAFPWREKGSVLENEDGPDKWQVEVLNKIRDNIRAGGSIKISVSSGHGIGKTALVAWIILWAMSTRAHLNGVITAGSKTQLETKTWRELAVWKKRAINEHWFEWTATKFYHKQHPETWFCACIPWREENSEAFAGQHEKPYNVLIIYDEASSIVDPIWEVSEGAMTTEGALWCAFGNPTKNTGRFRECFPDGKFGHRWQHMTVDSRTCKMANNDMISQWVEDWGEDSDFVKVRVRGIPPSAGDRQFIPTSLVVEAMQRSIDEDASAPTIIGADIARFGSDQTVFVIRHGRKLLVPINKYRELNTMQTSDRLAHLIDEINPDAVFVDGVGIGGAVIDRLKQLGYKKIFDVQAGATATETKLFANKRIEMWSEMRNWIRTADLPKDDELFQQLISPEYGYHKQSDKMLLESKDDLKKRGISSPDIADALALTFASPVRRLDKNGFIGQYAKSDYDMFDVFSEQDGGRKSNEWRR